MTKFEEVLNVNVNDKTEKKGSLTYLSWAWAWSEFKKLYPTATYEVEKFDGLPYVKDEKVGYMVYTKVTAEELTHEMWLPVMDARNKALLQPTMFDINKTIMRCLAKNLAMFGLGLYIYAGEDLPEEEQNEQQSAKQAAKTGNESVPKKYEPITKTELIQKWGVENAEQTVAWFEKRFGKKFRDWGEEETEAARGKLEEKKIQREQEAALREDKDIPFPMKD